MFTGIIEEVGNIENLKFKGSSAEISIKCSTVTNDIKVGDSIAVNGVCLTVTSFSPIGFVADVSKETLSRTSLKNAILGKSVNLERAIAMGGRFGGHIVQGHVDTVGTLLKIANDGDFCALTIEASANVQKFISEKGSITIDGISLTVAKDQGDSFTIAVIPHTYSNTNLHILKTGDIINIEVDVLARYAEKLLKNEEKKDNLEKLLADW